MTAPHSLEAVLEAALRYAADGYDVFPIRHGTKAPHRLVPGGFKDATAERAAIERWFQSAPDIDAIAAVPNSVRCAVIDIDTKADGFGRLAEYEACFGKLPETRTTLTPTGGEHRWFRLLQGVELQNHIGLFGQAGVDLIARSGYVLMPPSRHPAGGHYEEDAADAPIAELPNAWLRALSDPNATRAGAGAKPRGRHETLVARAVSLTKNGAAPENVSRRLHALNATFPEPKGRAEVDSIAEWTSGRIESDSPEMIELRRLVEYGNDAANAAHFAARCRGAAVYDATDHRWRLFTGKRWERDATGGIMRFAKATANELLRLATSIESEDARKAAVSYAIRLGGRRQLEAMIDLAKSELPALSGDFDADPHILNVANGTLDLRTGSLREHDPAEYLTKLAPVEYHEGATAPRWERFLDEIFLGRSDLIDYVHRLVGYALTADVSEHVLPIAYGLGANGKSVFVGALQKLLGDYALHADVSLFLARREHGATPELARLKGVRLVAASEMPEGGRLSENLIKSLTGGDRIAARHLYGEFFEFAPTRSSCSPRITSRSSGATTTVSGDA